MNGETNFTKESCKCGYDKSNPNIVHKSVYSSLGWILNWIGISAQPIRVNYVCEVCGEVIESTDNPEVLKKYVGR